MAGSTTSLTVLRNQVYATEIGLWQDTVLKSPDKARVHNNLGHAYLLAQHYDEARNESITTNNVGHATLPPQGGGRWVPNGCAVTHSLCPTYEKRLYNFGSGSSGLG
jgi:hypothetical protein